MMYHAHIVTVDIIEERLARELFFQSKEGILPLRWPIHFPCTFVSTY